MVLAKVGDKVRPDVLVELTTAARATASATSSATTATASSTVRGSRRSLAASSVRVTATSSHAGKRSRAAGRQVPRLDWSTSPATCSRKRGQTGGLSLLVLLSSEGISR